MKVIGIFILVFATSLVVQAQTSYKVDEENVKVKFYHVEDEVEGSLSGFEAEIIFSPDNLEESKVKGSVKASTINTGVKGRDNHLKTADFFTVEKYPLMSFESNTITKAEEGFEMKGTMTIMDAEFDVLWKFTFENNVFKARTVINGKQFGIGSSDVRIKLEIPVNE